MGLTGPPGPVPSSLIRQRTTRRPFSLTLDTGTPRAVELPGEDPVRTGVDDLAAGRHTAPALLVSLAVRRLRELGVDVVDPVPDADHRLWELLARDDPDAAHSRYNALVARLVSYERARACVA